MDYALNDRDLRFKKDVSDLNLDPLFWRRVLGKNYFFASYRIHSSAAVLVAVHWPMPTKCATGASTQI